MDAYKILKIIGIPFILFLAIFSGVFLLLNFIFNVIVEIYQKTFATGSLLKPEEINIDFSLFTSFSLLTTSLVVFLCMMGISFATTLMLIFKFKTNYGQLKKDQKGSARFSTFKEIQQQYRDVPDKGERFEGGGGIPVARYKDRLFIDDSPVNNMIIGTTRSGKGETFVFSAIDIYSRAEKQASMILNDPKGELYSASKDTLESLGYHVEVLNLMNPLQSMSYNLLQLTIDAFMEENYSLAQQYARSVAFMLYYDPKSKDPFWSNSSTDLCTALILALCEQCKHEPEKINMYNVALMLSDLGTRKVEDEDTGEEISALDDFFAGFPENHPAKMQYATINFSGGQTRASILANTNAKLGVFTLDGTAKLTSQNSYDMSKIGFGRWIKAKTKPDTRIHITFPNNKTETIRTDSDGMFTLYHKNPLDINDEIIVKVQNDKTTIKITGKQYKKTKDGDTKFEGHFETMTDNKNVKVVEVMEYDKPTAIFMIVPDYDATFNVIASLYVKQVYTNLARIASNAEGGKCHREVIFILDEFGNMPAIEGMANIVTVCLGRNIRFNLVIQAYAQLENLYGDDWKTIDGNCGNTLYLLTADESTAELISKKLGDKTILTKSRSGQTISLSKSKTESVDSRRLMTATEVMGLQEGEMIVLRVIKRQDKNRNRIKSYPIFLTGKTALKYRWEYLSDYYDTDKSINDIDIPCQHSMTDLNLLKANFEKNNYEMNKELELNCEESELEIEPESVPINQPETISVKEPENEQEPVLVKEQEILPQNKEEPLLEKEESENVIQNTKREMALKRQKERVEKNRKEQELHSKINGLLKASQVIPKGLMIQAFNGSVEKVEEYSDMGLMDFRDIVLSNDSVINDKICSIMLSKINHALEQIENDTKKGSLVNG